MGEMGRSVKEWGGGGVLGGGLEKTWCTKRKMEANGERTHQISNHHRFYVFHSSRGSDGKLALATIAVLKT